jgi:hypothetical protein
MPRGVPRAKTPPPTPELAEQPGDGSTQTDLVRAAIAVFEPDFESLNLQQKIARITGMVGGVPKRGYNAFHKYAYVMEADLVGAVRQYLAAAGIIIIPNAHKWEFHGEICMVDVEYIVTDGNESFTFSMPGAGSDRGDKGVYKAVTGSQKYALMKLFKIETGDDPEADTRVDERAHVSAGPPPRPTEVRTGDRPAAGVGRGAHTETASPVQIRRIAEVMKEEDLDRSELAAVIKQLFGDDLLLPERDQEAGKIIVAYLQKLESAKAGQLLIALSAYADSKHPEPVGSGGYGY